LTIYYWVSYLLGRKSRCKALLTYEGFTFLFKRFDKMHEALDNMTVCLQKCCSKIIASSILKSNHWDKLIYPHLPTEVFNAVSCNKQHQSSEPDSNYYKLQI
jgi:hypothetical protein